jgi:hypothetical protein
MGRISVAEDMLKDIAFNLQLFQRSDRLRDPNRL